jgi:hypothetical protein
VALSRPKLIRTMRIGPDWVRRLERRFYEAQASEYRRTLGVLADRYGAGRQVRLGAALRDGIRAAAERDARSVVATYNSQLEREAARHPELNGQHLADHLGRYMQERGRARAGFIAANEVAAARADAYVSFARENGVEPEFNFTGPKPKCPICTALIDTNPHSLEVVLAVGRPHIACTHYFAPRGLKAADLRAGGLRPRSISAGRGEIAGLIGRDPLTMELSGLSEEVIAEAIRRGELGSITKSRAKAPPPIFDTADVDDPWGQEVIASVEKHCSFDLDRLRVGLRRRAKRDTIRVEVHALDADTNAEVTVDDGLLEINRDMRPGGKHHIPLGSVVGYVIGEVGHFVDDYLLSPEQRTAIYRAVDPPGDDPSDHLSVDDWFRPRDYWARVGESFMAVFILAYSDLTPDQAHFKHKATPAAVALLRRALD